MSPISGEEAGVIADSLNEALPWQGRQQTRVVFTDDPSARLLSALQNVLPNLECLCLDPVHLCMTFEYGTFRKRTSASTTLRIIMNKFNMVDPNAAARYASSPYRGVNTPEFDHVTESRRGQILTGGMGKAVADKIMKELQGGQPWPSERSFVEALAAFVKTFPEAVDKTIPGPNRTGRQILHTACAPGRLQWYWNNLRARRQLSAQRLQMLPAGTASNEALHAEVRAWFRETQQMHQSTLRLKLRVLHLAKLIPHSAAMYRPTLRQISSGVVLARCALSSPWRGQTSWTAFAGHFGKALLPLQEKRKHEVAVVGQQALKKPARKRPAVKLDRRTPFTRKRVSKLRIMGKKR